MIKGKNEIIAEKGRILYLEPAKKYANSAMLGKVIEYIDGVKNEYVLTEDNIQEGYITNIDGQQRFVKASSYPELVTGLIRLKYSMNDELALMANSRIKVNNIEEKQFQNWRKKCKEIARQLIND